MGVMIVKVVVYMALENYETFLKEVSEGQEVQCQRRLFEKGETGL